MTIPDGFEVWRLFEGASDVPAEWTEAQRQSFMDWKLYRFQRHWRWMIALGQPDLIRQQSGRETLISEVKADLAMALAPPPSQVYGRSSHRRAERRGTGNRPGKVPPPVRPTADPIRLGIWARVAPRVGGEG